MTEKLVERILASALIIGLLVSIFFNVRSCADKRSLQTTSDTVRVTIIDTIKVAPRVKDSVVVRYIVEKLPIAKDTSKLPVIKPDTSTHLINGESKKDSAEVIIPIEQRVYEDSLYKAYVSGYKPSLDSLFIYPRKETITIANKTYHKPRRFGIGVQVGYGAMIGEQTRFAPYIGVGISYNFLTF